MTPYAPIPDSARFCDASAYSRQRLHGEVESVRGLGATDVEIHDTVLIAAAFCMYNRYVDGLGTTQPRDEAMYRERGKVVARDGYVALSKTYLTANKLAS